MSFDVLAPHYRWMEHLLAGTKLQNCRTAFLRELRAPRSVLLLGEGHGRFLVECRRQFPDARITYVDASAGMLRQARRALPRAGFTLDRTSFVHADIERAILPAERYDLVVTQFFFDCFPADTIERIIDAVAGFVAPEADWLVADFHIPDSGWKRWRAAAIVRLMYVFFRAVTRLSAWNVSPPDAALVRNGFSLRGRAEYEWGLLRSDRWRRGE